MLSERSLPELLLLAKPRRIYEEGQNLFISNLKALRINKVEIEIITNKFIYYLDIYALLIYQPPG